MQPGASDPAPIEPAPAAPNLIEPTLDERTMAILAHMLQILGLWIAPLIIFVIKRESRFVSFHALQALLLQVLYMFLMGLGVVFLVWRRGPPHITIRNHRHCPPDAHPVQPEAWHENKERGWLQSSP